MQSIQTSHLWAVECARLYFSLSHDDVDKIAGRPGFEKLSLMWADTGDLMYHSPLYAMRQEWFHEAHHYRRMPGFFMNIDEDATILDWGCGTGESCRKDWIEKDRRTILADIPGPNFEYTKHKFRNWRNVSFCDASRPIPYDYDAFICVDVLEHIPHPMKTLYRLWDDLRPGGQALTWFDSGFPHPGHLEKSINEVPAYARWLRDSNKFRVTGNESLLDWTIKPESIKRRIYEFFGGTKKQENGASYSNI